MAKPPGWPDEAEIQRMRPAPPPGSSRKFRIAVQPPDGGAVFWMTPIAAPLELADQLQANILAQSFASGSCTVIQGPPFHLPDSIMRAERTVSEAEAFLRPPGAHLESEFPTY